MRWNTFLQQIIIDVEKRYRDKDSGLCYVLAEDFVLPTDPSRYEESKAPISFEEDILSLYNALGKTRILLIFDEIELIGYTTSPSEHWKMGVMHSFSGKRFDLFFKLTLRCYLLL